MSHSPESFYLHLNNQRIHYLKFGSGEKLLFCFHGFGESAYTFSILQSSLEKIYTIISIDLPLHGLTQWNEKYFVKKDVKEIIQRLMNELGKEKCSLMGFSLGGKIVIGAMSLMPECVEEIFLIAPDGLRKNIWYNLAIYPSWGRKLFLNLVQHPEKYIALVKFFAAIKIVPRAMKKFVESQLETKEKRQQVFDVWMCIRDFDTKVSEARMLLNKHNIACYLFFGEFDQVIRPVFGKSFVRGLKNYQMNILPKGHNLVKDYLNDEITKVI